MSPFLSLFELRARKRAIVGLPAMAAEHIHPIQEDHSFSDFHAEFGRNELVVTDLDRRGILC